MDNQFMLLPMIFLKQQSAAVIQQCNDFTSRYQLSLTDEEIQQLIEHRREVLQQTGRVEFGGGVLQKIIMEFADSAYLCQQNYAESLMELQECFYYFKNEAIENLSDDELIQIMKNYYEEVCQGSIEFLQSTMLENYCRDIRYGTKDYRDLDGYEDNYVDFLDWDEKEY